MLLKRTIPDSFPEIIRAYARSAQTIYVMVAFRALLKKF